MMYLRFWSAHALSTSEATRCGGERFQTGSVEDTRFVNRAHNRIRRIPSHVRREGAEQIAADPKNSVLYLIT